MTKSDKRVRLAQIVEALKGIYPDAACSLEYDGDPWRLLIMGRLSAQCTDARVNIVCRELFSSYPDARSLAEAELSAVERIIMPCGLYRMKAKNIVDASKMLVDEYGGELPREMNGLLRLPGVGRKIANLLIGDVFGGPAVVCDTHCIRICGRLGMYPEKLKDPTRIEHILLELIDPAEGSDFCHRIVMFGRDVCTARSPLCESCPLRELCEHAKREERNGKKEVAVL